MPKLTRREKEIFNLLLDGNIPKEIAGKLKISYDTVVVHQKNIYRKLDIHSIDELVEKYRNKKDEIFCVPNTDKSPSLLQCLLKPKVLIPAGIAVILIVLILAGIVFTARKKAKEISLDPSRVYLEDGTYFTGNTFNDVNLFTNRWIIKEGSFYGENYHSNKRIRFRDVYNGTIDNLIPNPTNKNYFKVKLSGTVDRECKYMKIDLWYGSNDIGQWFFLGGVNDNRLVSIGPGVFSQEFLIIYEGVDIDTLPKGGIFFLDLVNQLLVINNDYIMDSGERIPEDMPNDKIWATINNLKIEPVF